MDHFEKTLSSRLIFEGKVVRLSLDDVLLENGKTARREIIRHPGGVCVAPVDAQGNVILVRQFRYAFGRELLELPAGKLEPGEDHAVCGRRELEEETGHTADIYQYIGCLYPTPAYVTEITHMYYAAGLHESRQRLDEDEFLSVLRVPFEEAVEMALDGRIRDAKTQLALLRLDAMRSRGLLPDGVFPAGRRT